MLKTAAGVVIGTGAPNVQKFMRRDEVVAMTGLPVSTIYEMMGRGEFPRPVRLSPRLVGWLETELGHWQAARIAERDDKERVT